MEPTLTGLPIIVQSVARARLEAAKGCRRYNFYETKERWAQIGIITEFLIVVRTIGEFFRLMHDQGTNFSTAVAALYVGGALIAACACWAAVTFYFFRRYMVSAWIALATIPMLLLYKVAVIGR